MKLATIATSSGTTAVRLDQDLATALPADDLGELMGMADWRAIAAGSTGPSTATSELSFAAPVQRPGKIICVGLNYRKHILETGRELPEFPTLFAKYPEALIGPTDDIILPPESAAMDWEGELAVVVGSTVRRADAESAQSAIAGYTIINDVTARDFQYRTLQWLQGKTFEATSPIGPVMCTPDEFDFDASLTTLVDGDVVQEASLTDLLFGPVDLVRYVSTILSLHPGDVIATGTPHGVGHAMKPRRYLADSARLTTRIDGIGELSNVCRRG